MDTKTSTLRQLVAAEDTKLPELVIGTRPTCDKAGVFFEAWADNGSRPYDMKGRVTGRLNIEQARGIIQDLEMMIRIALAEHGADRLP